MRYEKWLTFWLENYIKPSVKSRTYQNYKQMILRKIIPELGGIEMEELTPIRLQEYVAWLIREGNAITGAGLSGSSVNLIITIIQSSLKTAMLFGKTKEYIGDRIKRPKVCQKEVQCFTVAEQKKIEDAVLKDRRKKMLGIVLCLYSGLRIGELLALTWQDIDFKENVIFVYKTRQDGMCDDDCKLITGDAKTASSKRIIPIPKQLIFLLKTLKREQKTEYVISYNNKPIGIRSYQRSFSLLLKKLNIPHKGFHALRHTFATRALECGMDVKTLSEILGHKNATMTLNRYAHSLLEHKREMMDKLGRNFC